MRTLFAIWATAAFVLPAFAQEPGLFPLRDFITVELAPAAEVEGPTVKLSDIARFSGGADSERSRLMRLDIDELGPAATSVEITRLQVELRLRLAGVHPNSIRVTGASKMRVIAARPELSEQAFIRAAAIALADRLDTTPDRLHLRLASRFSRPYGTPRPGEPVRLEGRVASNVSANHATRIDVDVLFGGRVRETVPIYVETPVAPAGGIIGKEAASVSDFGMRKQAPPLSVAAPGTMPLKTRDRVRLIIRVGPVLVQAVGECEQDAAPGQMVRVRNVDSGKSVYGRLVDTGVVEVGN
ncbi:MAG: flagella basal body P-ring formation protein FlgA [Gemmataceae bacterium]